MSTPPLIADVIGLAFEGVRDDDALPQLAQDVARLCGGVSMFLQLDYGSSVSMAATYGQNEEVVRGYVAHYWRLDPWVNRFEAIGSRSVTLGENLISDHDFRESEIYNDLLRRNGDTFRLLGAMTPVGPGARMRLGVHRTRTQHPFGEHEVGLLCRLEPVLVSLLRARERAAADGDRLARLVLDQDPDALAVVSPDGRVAYVNRAAKLQVERGRGPLLLEHGRLRPVEVGLGAAFVQAVRLAARGMGGRRLAAVDRAGVAHSVEVDAVQAGPRPLAAVRWSDPAAALGRALDAARLSFGLTPAELELARALLQGSSPAEHARAREVRMSTVRSQLHSLFLKTGTARQGELVALLRAGATR